MALHRLMDMEIGAADRSTLDAFYQEIGFNGGNVFWYLLDPSGTFFFEYFTDRDRIVADDAWQLKEDWDPADSWSVRGEKKQPAILFAPADMATIIEGRTRQHA